MAGQAISIAFLEDFADAWNRHDVDAILAAMTPDGVLQNSFGPDICGRQSVGHEAIGRTIADLFAMFPDARWNGPTHFIAGDRGVTEWVFAGTGPTGLVEAHGCDVFTFRDGKIAVKDSYRKQRTA